MKLRCVVFEVRRLNFLSTILTDFLLTVSAMPFKGRSVCFICAVRHGVQSVCNLREIFCSLGCWACWRLILKQRVLIYPNVMVMFLFWSLITLFCRFCAFCGVFFFFVVVSCVSVRLLRSGCAVGFVLPFSHYYRVRLIRNNRS